MPKPNPRTIYLAWVMRVPFRVHHTQRHAPTECEHASGKWDDTDTDNVPRGKASIILGCQVRVNTYTRVRRLQYSPLRREKDWVTILNVMFASIIHLNSHLLRKSNHSLSPISWTYISRSKEPMYHCLAQCSYIPWLSDPRWAFVKLWRESGPGYHRWSWRNNAGSPMKGPSGILLYIRKCHPTGGAAMRVSGWGFITNSPHRVQNPGIHTSVPEKNSTTFCSSSRA